MHISVMIPTYNRQGLVEKAIESVLTQTHRDLDVVLVDDASTDRTSEAVRTFMNDRRFSVVKNNANLGLTGNWNKCLALARGPLVEIMQSDDLIDAGYLERVSAVFEDHPGVGFVAANCRIIDAAGDVLDRGHEEAPRLFKRGDEAVMAILKGGYPHVSSIVMRSGAIAAVGGFNQADWFAPDLDMDTKLALEFDFFHLGSVSTSFRKHGSNSGVTEFLRGDYLETYERLLRTAWGRLSAQALLSLGISSLNRSVKRDVAGMAVGAAAWMTAFGFERQARQYLKDATALNSDVRLTIRFWRMRLLSWAGRLGASLARRRLNVTKADVERAHCIESALRRRGLSKTM